MTQRKKASGGSRKGPRSAGAGAKKTPRGAKAPAVLPSRTAMEGALAGLFGGRGSAGRRPLDEAQQLMYEAWESPSRERRVGLATQALAISPDCADAYVLLAQESASSLAEVTELYRKAPHVPAYLLGRKKMPKRLPDYIGFGDENEAIAYVGDNASGWQKTAGALDWLAAQERAGAKPRPA